MFRSLEASRASHFLLFVGKERHSRGDPARRYWGVTIHGEAGGGGVGGGGGVEAEGAWGGGGGGSKEGEGVVSGSETS